MDLLFLLIAPFKKYIFFIMKNNDSINIRINSDFPAFQNSIVEGHSANRSLRKL